MDLVAEPALPHHHGLVEHPAPRAAHSKHRQPSSASAASSAGRPGSRERTATPPAHHAPVSKLVTSADQGGNANVNRWSRSTNSSAVSHHTHKRSNSSARRMSLGGGASSFLDTSSPPRKLQRPFLPTTSSPSQSKVSRPSLGTPSITLPLLSTLPGLQTAANTGAAPATGPPTTSSPSTAQILSAAVRNADYFGRSWEDHSLDPKDFAERRSSSTSRSAGLAPSPVPQSSFSTDTSASRRQYTDEEEGRSSSRGHSRHRSQSAKGSFPRRSSKQPSQKAMLSKALQKANTAVLLDNAQNLEGAMQAYSEACSLLLQVMQRSSGDEDRRKLEAIRNTYTSRIGELKKLAPHLGTDHKALPAPPDSREGRDRESQEYDEESAVIGTATVTRIVNDALYVPDPQQDRSTSPARLPKRRESLLPAALESLRYRSNDSPDPHNRSYSRSPMGESEMESMYMPPPLTPRRPSLPSIHGSPNNHQRQASSDLLSVSGVSSTKGHSRAASNESMSWLDTIDESGDSVSSSVHSRSSSIGVRRKHIRAPSGATETEFDTALDEAIEAAYDDGFEPVGRSGPAHYDYEDDDEIVASVRRKVELAKERVRQSEREAAIHSARDNERRRLIRKDQEGTDDLEDESDVNESEDEERMLEEMTRGYVMEDFEFGLHSKSALPRERESDSSGFSSRTWNSSIGSNPTTAGTTLSTVTETSIPPQPPSRQSQTDPSSHPPPPLQALPPLPPPPTIPGPPPSAASFSSVRNRRLSGQNAKQLKIETMKNPSPPPLMPPPRLPSNSELAHPKTAGPLQQQQHIPVALGRSTMPQSARQASYPFPAATSPVEVAPSPALGLHQTLTSDSEFSRSGSPGLAHSRSGLRKNFSSTSLKHVKSKNLSVSNFDDGLPELSPNTPSSAHYTSRDLAGKIPALPALPTPIVTAFMEKTSGVPTGGMYLFNSDIHSPESPGSPNPLTVGAPIPLEPCPIEYLLRPFWLMRALYQTIAHPRGGYLSTKLFVPRDVWFVKGVKIKGLEDKIANLDLLTAALMKLAQVDTYDADAVLEEMQSLEAVLEQVQVTLTKKLGSDVGVQTSGGIFTGGDAEPSNTASKSGSTSSKSSSFSWRRLRSKNSGAGLSNTYTNRMPTDGGRENLTMVTLPMTSTSTTKVRFPKRDVSSIQFSGPNTTYMNALAKLFDAAQAIDQIARQVEDPGLRHADKTQVGLELCTRHAAEFFGFYICRFVLIDIGLLLDKFIKRGSEWVNV